MTFKKKGMFRFQDVIMIAVIFVAAIIMITIGSQIMNSFAVGTCAGSNVWNATAGNCYNSSGALNLSANSYATNISVYGLQGDNTFASNMPTLAVVLIAAIIIGVLLTSFLGMTSKR